MSDVFVAPFLKWVGGKRQLVRVLRSHLPRRLAASVYCEPFIGGGALFFSLQPQVAVINDFNSELINTYLMVRDRVDDLIVDLQRHRNEADYYYRVRAWDRERLLVDLDDVQKASRIIFLNKTCYNGLYRVNNAGEFNTPFGRYKNPDIVNEQTLRAVSRYLNLREVSIRNADYQTVLESLPDNAFVYLDPPYHPVSETANFTGYIRGGWNRDEQIRLKNCCDALTARGIKFMLSNSSTAFIRELYAEYKIFTVRAVRSVNADAEGRGPVDEVLVKNYEE